MMIKLNHTLPCMLGTAGSCTDSSLFFMMRGIVLICIPSNQDQNLIVESFK